MVKERGEIEFIVTFVLVAISLYLFNLGALMVALIFGFIFNHKKFSLV
jgi:hypothetical protein